MVCPILLQAIIFLVVFIFLLQEINDSVFLGVDFSIRISQVTFISLNIRSLFVQEVTRYIRNNKVSYANIAFWMLQVCIFL